MIVYIDRRRAGPPVACVAPIEPSMCTKIKFFGDCCNGVSQFTGDKATLWLTSTTKCIDIAVRHSGVRRRAVTDCLLLYRRKSNGAELLSVVLVCR